MHDFPPVVVLAPATPDPRTRRTRLRAGGEFRAPGHPQPAALPVLAAAPAARTVLIVGSLVSVVEWLPGSVGPYLIGGSSTTGILAGDLGHGRPAALVLLGLALVGVVAGVLGHTLVVRAWLIAMYGPMKLVTRKSAQLGHVLPRRTPTGEVLSVSAGDSDEFGGADRGRRPGGRRLDRLPDHRRPRAVTSVQLGLVVLVAAPLLVLLAMPLLRPMERRQEVERNRTSDLTSLATDIVAGLRILRGIGGEQTFARNYAGSPSGPGRPGSRPASGRRRSTRPACCSPGCSW